jgi:cation:H+ antiporter
MFDDLSLPVLAAIFMAASATVWWARTRLSRYASVIADRTGLGQAVVGVVLLGFATSLPEVATTVTASVAGNAPMAVNNLLGGVAFQVVVLAVADLATGRGALTALVPSPKMMLLALVSIVLLVVVALGVVVGDIEVPLISVGLFPLLVAGIYLAALWILRDPPSGAGWKPARPAEPEDGGEESEALSNGKLALWTAGLGVAILVAGFALTRSAEGLAEQSGAGTAIFGLTLIAAATSLPELSTTIAAVRMRKTELAIGDVLGGNMFDVTLILLVDLVYTGGLALHAVDRSSLAAALIAVLLTSLVLYGLIERRDRTVLRMGYDSVAILLVYLLGMGAIVAGLAG